MQRTDSLRHEVSSVPNQLRLRIEPSAPVFSAKEAIKLKLHFQVVRLGTDRTVNRSGPVLLSSDYYNLSLPASIQLNANGEAETSIEVKPPRPDDRTFEGSVTFRAIIDQYGYDDLQGGSFKVKFRNP